MIADIEDIQVEDARAAAPRGVGHRRRVPKQCDAAEEPPLELSTDVPGTASVYLKTYGCSHNSSDSEYMAGQLQEYGYRLVREDERDTADLWLINSCTVKNPSEEHMVTDLKRGRSLGKALVVAGCVSQAQPDLAPLADLSIVGVQQVDRVVEVVQEALKGNTVRVHRHAHGHVHRHAHGHVRVHAHGHVRVHAHAVARACPCCGTCMPVLWHVHTHAVACAYPCCGMCMPMLWHVHAHAVARADH